MEWNLDFWNEKSSIKHFHFNNLNLYWKLCCNFWLDFVINTIFFLFISFIKIGLSLSYSMPHITFLISILTQIQVQVVMLHLTSIQSNAFAIWQKKNNRKQNEADKIGVALSKIQIRNFWILIGWFLHWLRISLLNIRDSLLVRWLHLFFFF